MEQHYPRPHSGPIGPQSGQAAPPIRLAALDLDGTRLDSRGRITPRTAAAIQAAVRQGAVIVPATGRPAATVPECVLALPGVRYAITANGAAVLDLGADPAAAVRLCRPPEGCGPAPGQADPFAAHVLARSPLPPERADAVLACIRPFDCEINLFAAGRNVLTPAGLQQEYRRVGPALRQWTDQTHIVTPDLAAYAAARPGQVEKFCLFFTSPAELERARTALVQLAGIELVQGAPDNLEITAPGVDKGRALLELARRLGVPPAATLAAGDSENDLQMLRAAGVAVVMRNGMAHVQAEADYVTRADCDHDGVAELLERFVLGGAPFAP